MPSFESVRVGDQARLSRSISEQDVEAFARLTGDFNPLHMDAAYAEKTAFGGRVAHGMLTASFLSTVVGMLLPGEGALYLSQELNFKKPVMIGDIIEITATVVQKVESTRMLVLDMSVANQNSQVVLKGKATVTWTTLKKEKPRP
jgi:3-hydroxybutyryl-CoA dehydratase